MLEEQKNEIATIKSARMFKVIGTLDMLANYDWENSKEEYYLFKSARNVIEEVLHYEKKIQEVKDE